MRLPPALFIGGLCLASLLDVAPVRTAEQALGVLLLPTRSLVEASLPEPLPVPGSADLAARAQLAWQAWVDAVAQRPPVVAPEREPLVVPVLAHDPLRRELLVQAPQAELEVDGPVTHRGVLVGFLRPWRRGSSRVVVDGQARVALLGHGQARPVAAAWLDEQQVSEPVHFLVASRDDGPAVTHRSRLVLPDPGQLAVTRDVRGLGDVVPAGLLLGRVGGADQELPGGARGLRRLDEIQLEGLMDPGELGLVTLEAPRHSTLVQPVLGAGLLPSGDPGGRRWMIDRGLTDGVVRGDSVVQDGRWFGRVAWVGPFTALVLRDLPGEPLLVESADQRLVPLESADFLPPAGTPVFGGHPALGGLVVGRVADDLGALSLEPVDPSRPVTVARR